MTDRDGDPRRNVMRLPSSERVRIYVRASLLCLLAACGSRGTSDPPAPSPSPTEPEKLGILYERLLVDYESPAPLFGPDDSVTVGARRWTSAGVDAGRHAFERSGQLHPVAIAGTPDAPRVIAIGWSNLDDVPPAPPAADLAWLVTATIDSEAPATTTAIHHEFLGENNFALSPDRTSLVTIERTDIVIRASATGVERARRPLGIVEEVSYPDVQRVCWLDDEHVAWIGVDNGASVLRVAAVHGTIATTPLAEQATIVACDPGGSAAAIAVTGKLAVLDLETAAITSSLPIDADREYAVAIGARGQRLAIASSDGFTLYRRDGAVLAPAYALAHPSHGEEDEDVRIPQLAFSQDGRRLAVVEATLLVIGDVSHAPPPPEVPAFAFDLPHGFTSAPINDAWRYAQLPVPSGRAPLPALLVQAQSDDDPTAHVIGLAVDLVELPRVPAATAGDAEMRAFAKRTMERWFEEWQFADLDATGSDVDYTIALGRTNGMRWFDAREIHRDGCEPYDGYTRVVLDTHVAYIVRAITTPGGKIDGWLAPFLDLPFSAHVKTALHKGPRTGPC